MSIKYNEFGEVISVNGLTSGQHLGTPMQDALGSEQDNQAYGEEKSTITRAENSVNDEQPTSGGSSKGLKLINTYTITIGEDKADASDQDGWNYIRSYSDNTKLFGEETTNAKLCVVKTLNGSQCIAGGCLLHDAMLTPCLGFQFCGTTPIQDLYVSIEADEVSLYSKYMTVDVLKQFMLAFNGATVYVYE